MRRTVWTHSYVGTIFGEAIFSASDPLYMLMLLQILSSDFAVWDKSASIRFRKLGRTTLCTRYLLTDIRDDVTVNG